MNSKNQTIHMDPDSPLFTCAVRYAIGRDTYMPEQKTKIACFGKINIKYKFPRSSNAFIE